MDGRLFDGAMAFVQIQCCWEPLSAPAAAETHPLPADQIMRQKLRKKINDANTSRGRVFNVFHQAGEIKSKARTAANAQRATM